MKKSEKTREHIAAVAIKLFDSVGFEKATMRAIAKEANLSLGAFYYYFETKEHIVDSFYKTVLEEHRYEVDAEPYHKMKVNEVLVDVISRLIKRAQPYKHLAKHLFRVASDKGHPLSPFHSENKECRDESIELYKRVLERSGVSTPSNIRDRLPDYFWLYQLAICTYWVYDTSVDSKKTLNLLEKSADLIAGFLRLASIPMVRGFTKGALDLLDEFSPKRGYSSGKNRLMDE